MLGYYDAQRGKLCPDCQMQGKRTEEQEEYSIFAIYVCPNGHEFEIDRIFEFDMVAFSKALREEEVRPDDVTPRMPEWLVLLWHDCQSERDLPVQL